MIEERRRHHHNRHNLGRISAEKPSSIERLIAIYKNFDELTARIFTDRILLMALANKMTHAMESLGKSDPLGGGPVAESMHSIAQSFAAAADRLATPPRAP